MDYEQEITKTIIQLSANRVLFNRGDVSRAQFQHAENVLKKRLTELRENDTIRCSEVM